MATGLFCRYVEQWKTHTGVPAAPVVVQCTDSTTQSGLFCTCYVVCEKLSLEGHVSVFHTIKALRLKQPGIVTSIVNIIHCCRLTRHQSLYIQASFATPQVALPHFRGAMRPKIHRINHAVIGKSLLSCFTNFWTRKGHKALRQLLLLPFRKMPKAVNTQRIVTKLRIHICDHIPNRSTVSD